MEKATFSTSSRQVAEDFPTTIRIASKKRATQRSNDNDEDDDNDKDDEDDDDDDGGGPRHFNRDGIILILDDSNILNEVQGARRSRRLSSGVASVMGKIISVEIIHRINQ